MDDDSLIKYRNNLMVKGIWIFLCIDIPLNLIIEDFSTVKSIFQITFPPLLFITYLVKKKAASKLTMYMISVLFIVGLFILNIIQVHYINLFFLILPLIFSVAYRNWPNILFTTLASAGVFAYFMQLNGASFFTQWNPTDIYYFLIFFFTYALVKIYESKFTEGTRIQLRDELVKVNQLKSKLHESEERYRSMLKQSSEGIYAFNPIDKSIVESNGRFCEMLGYSEQELLKLNLNDIIASDESTVDKNIETILNENRFSIGEKLYRRKDGTIITVEVRSSLVHFNNESVILVNVRDITEQKEIEKTLIENEMKYRIIADNMSDFITVLDTTGKILYASPSHENSLKINVSDLEGKYPFPYIHPDDIEAVHLALEKMITNRTSTQLVIRWKVDDDWIYLEVIGKQVEDENGEIHKVVASSRNITDRVKMEEQIRRTSARLEALISHIPYGILAEDKENRIILINKQFSKILNLPPIPEDVIGMTHVGFFNLGKSEFIEGDLIEERIKDIVSSRKKVLGEEWQLNDGSIISRDAIPIFINDEFDGYLWQFKDITEQRRIEQALKEASVIDGLTKIANRRFFDETVLLEWGRCSRNSKPLTLIMLDIDCFKNYNDTYGHQRGDECLIKVAQTIKQTIQRPSDIVFRYGGEEFAVILPETHQDGGRRTAEKIRMAIEELEIPHITSSVSSFVTCSLGVATVIPSRFSTPEEVIRMADNALYSSKHSGRNCVSLYQREESLNEK
jgi:diguanylate cyclase (GGDEF)-like protein/PAS domain S-box-containing protein